MLDVSKWKFLGFPGSGIVVVTGTQVPYRVEANGAGCGNAGRVGSAHGFGRMVKDLV